MDRAWGREVHVSLCMNEEPMEGNDVIEVACLGPKVFSALDNVTCYVPVKHKSCNSRGLG